MNAGTHLFWSGGLEVDICAPTPHPLELWFLGSSKPAAGFTLTRPFMILYIMQTWSDVLLDCRFPS